MRNFSLFSLSHLANTTSAASSAISSSSVEAEGAEACVGSAGAAGGAAGECASAECDGTTPSSGGTASWVVAAAGAGWSAGGVAVIGACAVCVPASPRLATHTTRCFQPKNSTLCALSARSHSCSSFLSLSRHMTPTALLGPAPRPGLAGRRARHTLSTPRPVACPSKGGRGRHSGNTAETSSSTSAPPKLVHVAPDASDAWRLESVIEALREGGVSW